MNPLLQSLLQKPHAPGLRRPRRQPPSPRGKKVKDPVPDPAIKETLEELEEVMPTTIRRGAKSKVAQKTVGSSKRIKRNAPIEPMDVDSMEVEKRVQTATSEPDEIQVNQADEIVFLVFFIGIRDEFPRYPPDDSLMLPQDLVNASGPPLQEANTTEESTAGVAVITSRVGEFEYSILEQVRPDVTSRTDSLGDPPANNATVRTTANADKVPDTTANFSMMLGTSEVGDKEAEASSLPPAAEDVEEKGWVIITPADSSEFVRTAASVMSSPPQGNRPASEFAAGEEVEAATGAINQGVIIDPAFSQENVKTAASFVSSPSNKDESAPGEHPFTTLAANSSIGFGKIDSDPVEAPFDASYKRGVSSSEYSFEASFNCGLLQLEDWRDAAN
ncbi:hypothetical protein RUND412_011474 [Rhizina undulata]